MTLKQLILENELENSTAAEIVTALNTPSVERRRNERIGWRTVALDSEQLAAIISLGLEGAIAAYDAAIPNLTGNAQEEAIVQRKLLAMSLKSYEQDDGLNFSEPKIQTQIDQLTAGGAWSSQTGAAIKALGIWQISKAEAANLGTITEQQATAALEEIAEDNARTAWGERFDELDRAHQHVRQQILANDANSTNVEWVIGFASQLLSAEQLAAITTALGE